MEDRRLVGIDLGITSAHTVRVLAGDGSLVCRRKAFPTVESLGEVEQAALTGATADTRLEIVIEPTGPAWLPIAVFFSSRGHTVYRVSSAKAADLRRSSGGTPRPTASTPTPWPASRWSTRLGCTPSSCQTRPGRRWTAASGPPTGLPRPPPPTSAASRPGHQLLPASPLAGELGQADLAVLERYADPHDLLTAGRARLARVIAKASNGQQGARRATQWLTAAKAALELYGDHPAIAFTELAAEVASEARLLRATQAELAAHATKREACYQRVDPAALARSLPGLASIGGPALVATMGPASRFASVRSPHSDTDGPMNPCVKRTARPVRSTRGDARPGGQPVGVHRHRDGPWPGAGA